MPVLYTGVEYAIALPVEPQCPRLALLAIVLLSIDRIGFLHVDIGI